MVVSGRGAVSYERGTPVHRILPTDQRLLCISRTLRYETPRDLAGIESCTKSVQLSFFTETGSYFRLIDSCITRLKAQGPFRTCNESKEEEEEGPWNVPRVVGMDARSRDFLRFR